MKTLYLEGAGLEGTNKGYSDIPNCRVRTAFTNDKGDHIYFEATAIEVTKNNYWDKKYPLGFPLGFVDSSHYITDDPDVDDENSSRIETERQFEFTYKSLLEFINRNYGCTFERVEILQDLAGYRVFKDGPFTRTPAYYNFGDEFLYDEARTNRRRAARDKFSEFCKKFMKYDNTSYWVAPDGNLNVRINTYDSVFKEMGIPERQFVIEVS